MNKKTVAIGVGIMSAIFEANSVEIEVTGIETSRGGNVIVFIFGEQGFPKKHEQALQRQVKTELKPTMTFEFEIPQQEIAIKVLHDEDQNGKVTKNWTGIYPAEGLGFSKEQKVTLTGAPIYRKSRLEREEFSSGVSIQVVYP
ncbi:hypothetical protein VIBNISO65_1690038 [Vibrio nigripulchritudo SO65]|uniref:DUF2141 domain-containing protein n=1 Tax=Vibrio nigripulchritudo TaxID=28173 RepID=UPI0003B1A511|nr:DUF2141 domain-containing protein [Vibrio nigripulchritudo]CCN37286.1 hypothetical protein VIBNIAM115_550012 [Vibrio nigripulchritudo AM115]CCN41390.1 hypothetical protein VIBNIFTn2_1590038 [Vibrio nigripulchritudo FTn2]CCN64753.1 hypothetical protein VIBNIPon4_270038 [Vibrio nigripulchritudo POn4]CCN76855.1 hypothetical protein VIBNISO65_1690038 [Vibrio nigripulchritudo SO65]